MQDGLKILGAPMGSRAYVNGMLQCIALAVGMLDLVAEADGLLLQHKLILLWQCITQILTFWVQAVPGVAATLEAWDEVLVEWLGMLVDVNLMLYLFHMVVAHMPA